MPSEISQQIVNQIFSGDKASAIDSINDGLGAAAFNVVQQKKIEFAKEWGFDLGDTGQEVADELADTLSDGSEEETPTAELPQEETTDEDDETDS